MATLATVVLSESNTGSETVTDDISNINFGSNDSPELNPVTYPITAEVDGHSFEKWLRFKVTDMGDSTIVDNFKVWVSDVGDGWGVGEGISCNLIRTGYVEAVYPVGGPVDDDSTIAIVVIPEEQPANANVGVSGSLTGQIIAAPNYTDYVVLQMDVSENTPSGSVNQKTITFQWDEQ